MSAASPLSRQFLCGKTLYLLSGLDKGLKLFSAELVHFKKKKGVIVWFLGALVDNVRIGILRHHFPRFMPDIPTSETKDEWQEKIGENRLAEVQSSLLKRKITTL